MYYSISCDHYLETLFRVIAEGKYQLSGVIEQNVRAKRPLGKAKVMDGKRPLGKAKVMDGKRPLTIENLGMTLFAGEQKNLWTFLDYPEVFQMSYSRV